MVEPWSALGLLAAFLSGGIAGSLACVLGLKSLRASVTSLRFDVATLEERLYREVKTRASALGVKARRAEDELLDQLKLTPPNSEPPQPWWIKHVHPDLTKH